MTYRRHEDDEAEYRHDEADARRAGYRRVHDPRGGTRLIHPHHDDPTEEFYG